MILKLAWRNIWRNKRRTNITILTMAMGVMAILSLSSYQRAAWDSVIVTITTGLTGHLQVLGIGYQEAPDLSIVVPEPADIKKQVLGLMPGADVEMRIMGAALAGTDDASAGVVVIGADVENTYGASFFTVKDGRTLDAGSTHEVLIGTGIGKELGVSLGDDLILFGQAADGSLANDRYSIVGLVDAGSSELNDSAVIMPLAAAQSFFSLDGGVHQLIVRLPGEKPDLEAAVGVLRRALDPAAVEAFTWAEILPEIAGTITEKEQSQAVIAFIVFLIVALGLLNTTTMSTFERTREFGVMTSLGTRRSRILRLILTETFLMGVIGFLGGIVAVLALFHYLGAINLSALSGGGDVLGVRMPEELVITLYAETLVLAGITTMLTMLGGSLLPAYRASRLKPVDAMRYQ
jgi:putative ABC transport system permease protein